MVAQAKALLVYYSRTGANRKVATTIAEYLPCDIEELVDTRNRTGIWGYVHAGLEARLRSQTVLQPTSKDPASYDLVIIGSPVWSSSLSTPVRTYLAQNQGRFKHVALFVVHRGSDDERTFKQMSDLCGLTPVATLAVARQDLSDGADRPMAQQFAQQLAKFLSDLGKPRQPRTA